MARKETNPSTAAHPGPARGLPDWIGSRSIGIGAGIAVLVALSVALAPRLLLGVAGAQSAAPATRSLPDEVFCGETVEVTLAVDAPAEAEAWLVDEVPPADVSIGSVDGSNNGAASDGHVKWVSTTGDDATVTYNVTVPEATPDGTVLTFAGEYNDTTQAERTPVGGDADLVVACGSVERALPAKAGCGDTVEVSLTVDSPASGESWIVDEVPPSSVDVTDVDDSHNGTLVDGHVKWVSTDGNDDVVTYNVTVPESAADGTVLVFEGTHRLFPAMDERGTIEGDDALSVSCATGSASADLHPFDQNGDCVFGEDELFTLVDQWKSTGADDTPTDDELFEGISHWKLGPDPYCNGGE